jgi:hypothetical protein
MAKTDASHALSRRNLMAAAAAVSTAGAAGAKADEDGPVTLPQEKSNFGECAADQDLMKAWKRFCRQLEASGAGLFKKYNPPTPLMRADGFRFLTQNIGQAFALTCEVADSKYPALYPWTNPYQKLGGDNADQVQHEAFLDGESVYKVSGNKGSARFFSFLVSGTRPEKVPGTDHRSLMWPFGEPVEASMSDRDLVTDWEGNFELHIGGPQRGPNWLPTTPHTRRLRTMQVFDGWDEKPARMRIERVGMAAPRPVATPGDMVKAINKAERFVADLMLDWPDWAYEFSASADAAKLNEFPHAQRRDVKDPNYSVASDRIRNRSIINMTWKLAPDEALVMEFDDPKVFWAVTNMGVFMNSMDYLTRPVTSTPSKAKVDQDGKIRLILAHEDPGYHNWIDTQRFDMGNLTSRVFHSDLFIQYRTRLVKHAGLAAALPADSAKVTPEERTRQMLARFHAIQMRYAW